jgi:hypothetical protein
MQFVKPENTQKKGIEREDNFTHSSSQKISVREREREILHRSSCGERRKLKRRSSSHGGRKQSNRLQIARSAATPSTLFLSLSAGNSVAHRRKHKAYYSLSRSLCLCLCAFLWEEKSVEDRRKCGRHSCNFCLEPCSKILRLFADFDERHKNEEIAKLSLSLSLSLSQRQASRQLQQHDDVDPGEGRIDR